MNIRKLALALAFATGLIAQADAGTITVYRIPYTFLGGVPTVSAGSGSGSGSTPAPPDPNGPTYFQATTCGATGNTGPATSDCLSHYGQNPGTSFSVTNGIQHWTVPADGNYLFDVEGADGGSYTNCAQVGYGATMKGHIVLTKGTVVDVLVGQRGLIGGNGGSGGGATYFVANGVLVAVAGGGSGCPHTGNGTNASTLQGTTGSGGQNQEAGAGYTGNAGSYSGYGQALSYQNGGTGSSGGTTYGAVPGGFGGGGGGGVATWGGGGGGYDGGNAGSGGKSYIIPAATTQQRAITHSGGAVAGSFLLTPG